MDDFSRADIEDIVRQIVMEAVQHKKHDTGGILAKKLPEIVLTEHNRFDTGKPQDHVLLKDVLTLGESPRLGCGLMELRKTTFDWTLEYDEIDYVIDGRLEINYGNSKICADKGEIIFIPKSSKIQFCVPDYSRFMYVTYPADWQKTS